MGFGGTYVRDDIVNHPQLASLAIIINTVHLGEIMTLKCARSPVSKFQTSGTSDTQTHSVSSSLESSYRVSDGAATVRRG